MKKLSVNIRYRNGEYFEIFSQYCLNMKALNMKGLKYEEFEPYIDYNNNLTVEDLNVFIEDKENKFHKIMYIL